MMAGIFGLSEFYINFVKNRHDMKKILAIIVFTMCCICANAQYPKGYEAKTEKLAENFVKSSMSGNYNKTYQALRSIQKYEYRLTKEQLVAFYHDIHEAVAVSCDRHGIDSRGKDEMKVVIDALFSDELKETINR
mgnify:CR=1 FL=1